jgi:uncharacterized membrane protein
MATSKTATNLSPNVASALCYAPFIGWIVAVLMLVVEKNSDVKWNAMQSLLLSLVLFVVGLILPMTIILIFLVPIFWVVGLILNLILALKAYQGNALKLPVLSGWADKLIKKM